MRCLNSKDHSPYILNRGTLKQGDRYVPVRALLIWPT